MLRFENEDCFSSVIIKRICRSRRFSGRISSSSPPPVEVSLEGRGIAPTSSCLFAGDEDCGCGGPEILSGDVPEGARTLNPRAAMRKAKIYRTSGEAVSMDELLRTNSKLSIVVFLRSLG